MQVSTLVRRLAIGAVAALAAAVPASGLGAVAGLEDDQLTVADVTSLDHRFQQIESTGAKMVRVDVLWSDVAPTKPVNPTDPGDPAYHFTRLDQIVIGLTQRGITPLVCVYSSPKWAAGGKRGKERWNAFAPSPAAFGQFMGALARRYNGTFRPLDADYGPSYSLVLPRVRHYELWNEPNLQLFFRPQYDRRKKPVALNTYVKLVRAAYPQIKRVNRQAIVLAGAAGPKSRTDASGQGSRAWLDGIRRAHPTFTAYSQHIYPAQPPLSNTQAFPSWNSLGEILATLNRIRSGMKLYITEAGYTTRTTSFRKVKVSESQQRTYLKQIFNLKAVRNPRVRAILWFNLQDNKAWPGGLLRPNGTRKPSFAAFVSVAKRTADLPADLRP